MDNEEKGALKEGNKKQCCIGSDNSVLRSQRANTNMYGTASLMLNDTGSKRGLEEMFLENMVVLSSS